MQQRSAEPKTECMKAEIPVSSLYLPAVAVCSMSDDSEPCHRLENFVLPKDNDTMKGSNSGISPCRNVGHVESVVGSDGPQAYFSDI